MGGARYLRLDPDYRFSFRGGLRPIFPIWLRTRESTCSKPTTSGSAARLESRSSRAGGCRSTGSRARSAAGTVPHAGGFHPVSTSTDQEFLSRGRFQGQSARSTESMALSRRSHAASSTLSMYFGPGTRAALSPASRIAAGAGWAPSVRKANRQMVIYVSRSARTGA